MLSTSRCSGSVCGALGTVLSPLWGPSHPTELWGGFWAGFVAVWLGLLARGAADVPVRAGGRGLAGDVCDDLVFGWVSRDEFSSAVSSELAAFGAQECPLFFPSCCTLRVLGPCRLLQWGNRGRKEQWQCPQLGCQAQDLNCSRERSA